MVEVILSYRTCMDANNLRIIKQIFQVSNHWHTLKEYLSLRISVCETVNVNAF